MTRHEKKLSDDSFYAGVLVSLQCVYVMGDEGSAEEIVRTVGHAPLLRIAKQEQDISLKDLRKTVRYLRSVNRL